MKEHYCTYEQSVALKRLGFAEKVNHGYSRKVRIEPDLSYGDVKGVHSKDPKNYNDNRKGLAKGIEFCSAPRLGQAAAWMREKGWYIEVFLNESHSAYGVQVKEIPPYWRTYNILPKKTIKDGGTYEQALSAGIDEALELLGKEVKE